MAETNKMEHKTSEFKNLSHAKLKENISKCISNYIIVERILTNLGWKDQLNCAETCRLWNDVVRAVQRKCLRSYDFILTSEYMRIHPRPMQVPPMMIFAFSKHASDIPCHIAVCPDNSFCEDSHRPNMLHIINDQLCDDTTTVLHIEQDYRIFSTTSKEPNFRFRTASGLCGLYLPKIPNVSCHSLTFQEMLHVQRDVYDVVDRICSTDVMKAVIVFIEDNIIFETASDHVEIISYFKKKQPNVGFALGGCMVDRCTWRGQPHREGWRPTIKIAVLSVPKTSVNVRPNFDVYSLIIPQSATKKASIEREISDFAARVPEYQHTGGLKLSCVGRNTVNAFEVKCLHKHFPNTSVVGCCGDGEIGMEHPARPAPPAPRKRPMPDKEVFMYAYSTVFLYFGWGKITKPPQISSQ